VERMDLLNLIAQNTYTTTALKRRSRVLKEYFEKKAFGSNLELRFIEEDKAWLNSLPNEISTQLAGKNLVLILKIWIQKLIKLIL
jgi:hypothetical protein